MKKILVPIDGSENSIKALNEAKLLATAFNSDITILNVVTTTNLYIEGYEKNVVDINIDASKKLLQASLEMFEGCNLNVDILRKFGDIPSEIIKVAEEGNYDLVVMGSRGLGMFSRALMGSVSNKILNHLNKNVYIVK